MKNNISNCRICGQISQLTSIGRSFKGFPLYQCPNCNTVLVTMQTLPDNIVRIYDDLFETGDYGQHRKEFDLLKSGKMPQNIYRSLVLKQIKNRITGRNLVEIGGGTGSFGVLARSQGWDYTNFDISNIAVSYCKELDLKAFTFTPPTPPPLEPNSADVVIMWEVLEHIWNLSEYIDTILDALKPQGIFVFSTPNYKTISTGNLDRLGRLSSPPVHVNFFTQESLEKILFSKGFNNYSVSYKFLSLLPTIFSTISRFVMPIWENRSPTLYGIAQKK